MSGVASMTEAGNEAATSGAAEPQPTAGALLRAARENRGLHIAALAAAMKLSPRTLESLEADRYDELLDLTFTRALALTVCRTLKIDAEPILARLPQADDATKLGQMGAGLNTPFRERPGQREPTDFALLRKPVFWATLLVLIGTLVLATLPGAWIPWRAGMADAVFAPAPPGSAVSGIPPSTRPDWAGKVGATIAAPTQAIAGPSTAVDPRASVLAVRSTASSWLEVHDAAGKILLARDIEPGETVGVDGELPLRVTIGNAAATQLVFRGLVVDLAASTRDNVARLQLP